MSVMGLQYLTRVVLYSERLVFDFNFRTFPFFFGLTVPFLQFSFFCPSAWLCVSGCF